jgi:hypothetical protein
MHRGALSSVSIKHQRFAKDAVFALVRARLR